MLGTNNPSEKRFEELKSKFKTNTSQKDVDRPTWLGANTTTEQSYGLPVNTYPNLSGYQSVDNSNKSSLKSTEQDKERKSSLSFRSDKSSLKPTEQEKERKSSLSSLSYRSELREPTRNLYQCSIQNEEQTQLDPYSDVPTELKLETLGTQFHSSILATPEGEEIENLRKQLRIEKASRSLLEKKLEHNNVKTNEEKALLLQEISHFKLQLENEITKENNINEENSRLKVLVDQQSSEKLKFTGDIPKLKAELEEIRKSRISLVQENSMLNANVDKEKSHQLSMTIELTRLKSMWDSEKQKSSNLMGDLERYKALSEEDSRNNQNLLGQIQQANIRLQDSAGSISQLEKDIETEKETNQILAKEIQDLKLQLKRERDGISILHGQVQKKQEEKLQLVENIKIATARLKQEQQTLLDIERHLEFTTNNFGALDKKRQNYENLGYFSERLKQTVPTFEANVKEIAQKLSEHVIDFREQNSTESTIENNGEENIRDLFTALKESTEKELQKHTQLFENIAASINSIQSKLDSQQR